MNEHLNIQKEVAMRVDLFQPETKTLGQIAARAFAEKHKAQLKGLENIANSALKVSDVLDYIKRQTGKSDTDKGWKAEQFGAKLLEKIEQKLREERDKICTTLKISADATKLDVYLLLIREFVRQVVIQYEFEVGKLPEDQTTGDRI